MNEQTDGCDKDCYNADGKGEKEREHEDFYTVTLGFSAKIA